MVDRLVRFPGQSWQAIEALHLPADSLTIWYTVTPYEGNEVISIQHVRIDT